MRLVKISIKLLLILAGSIFLGTILLYLAFLLPSNRVRRSAETAAYVFSIETGYPYIDGKKAKGLDNHTDALMITETFFEKEGSSTLEKAMKVYRPNYNEYSGHGCDIQLMLYLDGGEDYSEISYPRYWHGYIVFLKPFLMIADYLAFRSINSIIQGVIILLISALLLCKTKSLLHVAAFLLTVLFVRPDVIRYSMFYSTLCYITLLSTLAVTLFHKRLSNGDHYYCFFFIIGIMVGYLDLLTYPVMTLGIPLGFWLCFERERSCWEKLRQMLRYSVCWLIGYAGMWTGKWIFGSILLRENILADAWRTVLIRMSLRREAANIAVVTPWEAIKENFNVAFEHMAGVVIVSIVVVCLLGLLRVKRDIKEFAKQVIPFLVLGFMPILWYIVVANHSYVHSWFTYRTLSVSVFAILLIMTIRPAEEKI